MIIYGSVISKNDNEIIFVEKKSGLFHSPDTLVFPLNEINAIIDSGRNCIYGEIPEKFSEKAMSIKMHLIKKDQPDLTNIYLELESNKKFSYCIPTGTYSIQKMEFIYKKGIDESLEIPFSDFQIEPNTSNYLGTIQLLQTIELDENIFKIPFKNTVNNSDAAMAGFWGGLIGAVIYAAIKESDSEISGYYYFKIGGDKDYASQSGLNSLQNILKRK